MSTGIIAALAGNTSVTYTPNSDTKIALACSAIGSGTSGIVSINGIAVFQGTNTFATANGMMYAWVAAGQSVTITANSNSTCVVSALES